MQVAVLDTNKQVLEPTTPRRARILLTSGKAAVFRRFPFTIILKHEVKHEVKPIYVVKIDPGSTTTGIVVLNQTTGQIVFAIELTHQGELVKDNLRMRSNQRRSRRNRKTAYREPRFHNRSRQTGWLPPSLESRLSNTLTWVKRLMRYFPIGAIVVENVKFDTQLLENPDIAGIEYQQGTLAGYEIREYVLERDKHKCVYCGAKDVPLQLDHIIPRSRNGHHRPSNLCAACQPCNQRKNNLTAAEFGFPDLQEQVAQGLSNAAAVNSTRKKLLRLLKQLKLPVTTGSGALTKFNRTNRQLPKTHWLDAACVGEETPAQLLLPESVLLVKAKGHGSRQMCRTDEHGKPIAHRTRKKDYKGWKTGDIARATPPNKPSFAGRVTIRQRNSFLVSRKDVNCQYLVRLHRKDGYEYGYNRVNKQEALAHSN